jgi:hypothetical protein
VTLDANQQDRPHDRPHDSAGHVVRFGNRRLPGPPWLPQLALPAASRAGPVSLVVGAHWATIRPLDSAPGYLVPGGRPEQRAAAALGHGSALVPGPVPGDDWVVPGETRIMSLLGPGGHRTGIRITVPARMTPPTMAEGKILLVAVGPTRSLGISCRRQRCQDVVIDTATGTRRFLPGPSLPLVTWPTPWQSGVVSASGSTAAVLVPSRAGGVALDLVSLDSGAITPMPIPMPIPITASAAGQALAWSPDSRWLFVVAAGGRLVAIDARSRQVHGLTVPLPALRQIAIRAAPR